MYTMSGRKVYSHFEYIETRHVTCDPVTFRKLCSQLHETLPRTHEQSGFCRIPHSAVRHH